MPRRLSRRTALIGAGAIVAIPVTGYAALRAICGREQQAALNAATLAGVTRSPAQAILIGKSYVERDFGQADINDLLEQDLDVAQALRLDCVESGITRLAALIHRDFSSQRIEVVNDWILSKTELVLCALIYRLSLSRTWSISRTPFEL